MQYVTVELIEVMHMYLHLAQLFLLTQCDEPYNVIFCWILDKQDRYSGPDGQKDAGLFTSHFFKFAKTVDLKNNCPTTIS